MAALSQPSCSEAASATAPLSHPITLSASQPPSQLHPAAPKAPSSAFSSPLPPGENATSCPPRGWMQGTRPVPFVGCPVPHLHPERGAQRKPLALEFFAPWCKNQQRASQSKPRYRGIGGKTQTWEWDGDPPRCSESGAGPRPFPHNPKMKVGPDPIPPVA